ncbi:NADH-quinone oxidoreductase subunit NuoK [Acidianus hospitalis]|jgi:NADH-quinone oxidoreductase subunit K|uniref:NADH-quinone oxidoreductase subunit NuoK n=2 Tax=Acidianus hospitalis TaxID=563177 RepID=A0A2T9X5J0_9CREN|nr:NADH-quinone oxidoreductase subunit NuoK [Acidianus hospitalis]AEE94074.1 NADH-ubiquinone oxidoreductase chain 4L [Acidianus hospitalis W1]PVU75312.1 NADH-quinone oxidoreductase subunit NuoK [Acidianus hospitalis]
MILGEFGVSLSITLIGIGIYGLINSRNIIRILLSSEIILNSTILLVFSISSLLGKVYSPIIFSVFAISMALIEVVVAFASIILYYRNKGSLEVD